MVTCATSIDGVVAGNSSFFLTNVSFTFSQINYPGTGVSTLLTGVRQVVDSTDVLLSGFYTLGNINSNNTGFVFQGNITNCGTFYSLNHPSSPGRSVTGTALYGPNSVGGGIIQVVGNYFTAEKAGQALGTLYQGPIDGSGYWTDLDPQSLETKSRVINVIAHSNMGNLVVGNYDTNLVTGKGFLYNINTNKYYSIMYPGSVSTTAYGIWYNGGDSYTIAGGYDQLNKKGSINSPAPTRAYLMDWNSTSNSPIRWKSFSVNNNVAESLLTHFEGITSDGNGGYNLVADVIENNGLNTYYVTLNRTVNGGFGLAKWYQYSMPFGTSFLSANTIINDQFIGVYKVPNDSYNYGYVGKPNITTVFADASTPDLSTAKIPGTSIIDLTIEGKKLKQLDLKEVYSLKIYSSANCVEDDLVITIKGSHDPVQMFYATLQCDQAIQYGVHYRQSPSYSECLRFKGDLTHELGYDCRINLYNIINDGTPKTEVVYVPAQYSTTPVSGVHAVEYFIDS